MRITIGRKIGSGFAVLGLILLLCGVASYWVELRLTDALHFITGPAMDTARTVATGIQGVQRQLIAVDRIMRGSEGAAQELDAAIAATGDAYGRIREAGLLKPDDLMQLKEHTEKFDASRKRLLQSHGDRLEVEQALDANVAHFQDFLIVVEKEASQHILELQMKTAAGVDTDAEENAARDSINGATEARLALLSRQYLLERLLSDPDEGDLARQMANALEDLGYAIETAGQSGVFARILDRGDYAGMSYRVALQKLVERHAQLTDEMLARNRAALDAWGDYRRNARDLEGLGERIDRHSRARMDTEVAGVESIAASGTRIILSGVLLGLVVALGVSFMALRTIALPIRQVLAQLQAVAEGDGDLTVQLAARGRDEVADLARAFNGFTSKLRDMIVRLQGSIHSLGGNTDEISRVAQRTGAEVRRQQQEIADIATAMDDLSGNVQAVAADTRQAARQAEAASEAAREGQQIVTQTRSLTERLSTEVGRAAEVIHRLGQEGERIGGVLDVIRDISEQTNLLALNAAIEAARAGEHGRGFAVVADEVRNLAARTHDSTNEIRDMIDRLQQGTQEAVQVMMNSNDVSKTSVEHATRTAAALDAIRDAVAAISELNLHIAEMSENQTRSTEAVNVSVVSVNQVAASTVEDADELGRSTEGLMHLAGELDVMAERFRV